MNRHMRLSLSALGKAALLNLNMRLARGAAAAVCSQYRQISCPQFHSEWPTFDQAGVSDKDGVLTRPKTKALSFENLGSGQSSRFYPD